MWRPGHMSFRADSGVLLQHAWNWFFNTSLSYSCSRYAHCCHTGVGIRCASCPKGRAILTTLVVSIWGLYPKTRWSLLFVNAFLIGVIVSLHHVRPLLRFVNIVTTFFLHPLSHYNSITEPHARFLLSLLEHLIIDFPSYFILSLIDMYRDMATHDKLIFPSAIMRILCHFFVPFPSSDHFPVICAIDYATVKQSEA